MPELDVQRIAAAALAVANRRGVAGFTMRAVAKALRVTPMALYHHVKNKAELAALVVDAAVSANPMPPPSGVWQDDLWQMAHWMRRNAFAHPAIPHLRRSYRVWTPSMLRMTERWLSLWQRSGLDSTSAVRAAVTSSRAIVGLVEEEAIFRQMDLPAARTLETLPGARRVFNAGLNPEAEYELAVRSLIDGVHARLMRSGTKAQTKPAKRSARRR